MSERENRRKLEGAFAFDGLSSLTVAAHELKAPLSVMRQLALELQDPAVTPEEQAAITQQIQLVAERALRFSSNLTKSQAAQTRLFTTAPINPIQVLQEVERELQPLYKAHRRRLVQRSRRNSPLVVANYDLLRRILLNFADNALHYTNEDGVVELFMTLRREQSQIRLGVRDHGPALPSKLWLQVTAANGQPQPVSARPDSSGLGLAIVSRFAEAIGGRVGATRHRDGATFYVDLPISNQLSLL